MEEVEELIQKEKEQDKTTREKERVVTKVPTLVAAGKESSQESAASVAEWVTELPIAGRTKEKAKEIKLAHTKPGLGCKIVVSTNRLPKANYSLTQRPKIRIRHLNQMLRITSRPKKENDTGATNT